MIVKARTTGWVGLGLSHDGDMPNSDIIWGNYIVATGPNVVDRFAYAYEEPPKDNQQDVTLVVEQCSGMFIYCIIFNFIYLYC